MRLQYADFFAMFCESFGWGAGCRTLTADWYSLFLANPKEKMLRLAAMVVQWLCNPFASREYFCILDFKGCGFRLWKRLTQQQIIYHLTSLPLHRGRISSSLGHWPCLQLRSSASRAVPCLGPTPKETESDRILRILWMWKVHCVKAHCGLTCALYSLNIVDRVWHVSCVYEDDHDG